MPKKRILPYVLLGLINNQGSMSGYQISQEFKTEIGDFWHASHSQIYPELQRMKDDNCLDVKEDTDDKKSTFYILTSTGDEQLRNWMEEPLKADNEEIFSLKLFFVRKKDDRLLKTLLSRQLELNNQKYQHLQDRLKEVFYNDDQINNNYGHYLILTRAIEREKNHINWLNQRINEQ
jgi:Predicted transcriptional regulators